MEIRPVKNEETGDVQGWVLLVGDLKFSCATQKEAEYLELMLLHEKNREILLFLQQQWDDDILEALQRQHLIFKVMILVMLELDGVIWGEGMAAQLVWVAVDFCVGLQQSLSNRTQAAPAQQPPRMGR